MKKNYSSPFFGIEMFEAADVITVSTLMTVHAAPTAAETDTLDTVDLSGKLD